tara:strand:- start:390 stop:1016 length:627 start_codon:yes stop_codon:yes gene_type:complete
MSFWTNKLEIKRSYRWLASVTFRTVSAAELESSDDVIDDFSLPPFLVHSFTKPSLGWKTEEFQDNMSPAKFVIANDAQWAPITINLFDVREESLNASKTIFEWLGKIGFESDSTTANANWVDALDAIQKLSKGYTGITLDHIDANGKIIETWDMQGSVLKAIDYGGELSYDSDDKLLIKLGFEISGARYSYIYEENRPFRDDSEGDDF